MHNLISSNALWWAVGRYGGIALAWLFFRFRRHLPHRHDGYVAMNGYVHRCAVCGREPKNLASDLAEVKAYIERHPWAAPYMGPDAGWRAS